LGLPEFADMEYPHWFEGNIKKRLIISYLLSYAALVSTDLKFALDVIDAPSADVIIQLIHDHSQASCKQFIAPDP